LATTGVANHVRIVVPSSSFRRWGLGGSCREGGRCTGTRTMAV
jgi:hypothetical protein